MPLTKVAIAGEVPSISLLSDRCRGRPVFAISKAGMGPVSGRPMDLPVGRRIGLPPIGTSGTVYAVRQRPSVRFSAERLMVEQSQGSNGPHVSEATAKVFASISVRENCEVRRQVPKATTAIRGGVTQVFVRLRAIEDFQVARSGSLTLVMATAVRRPQEGDGLGRRPEMAPLRPPSILEDVGGAGLAVSALVP